MFSIQERLEEKAVYEADKNLECILKNLKHAHTF